MKRLFVLALLALSGCRPGASEPLPPDVTAIIQNAQARTEVLQGRVETTLVLLAVTAGVLLIAAFALAVLVYLTWRTGRTPHPTTPEKPE